MSQHARKPSATARDHMIARHTRPNSRVRTNTFHSAPQNRDPEAVTSDSNAPTPHSGPEMLDGEATLTSTSALDLLTTEGQTVNLHTSKHAVTLSHAIAEMKRLDTEFGNPDCKSDAEREILLQEMLPEFLPMRAVWKQEWNILRRRKTEILHNRWEQGIHRKQQEATPALDIAAQITKAASEKRNRRNWGRISRVIGYILPVVIFIVVGLLIASHIQPVLAEVENIKGMDSFL